jgi:hypothetical protein
MPLKTKSIAIYGFDFRCHFLSRSAFFFCKVLMLQTEKKPPSGGFLDA